jgi:chaperonin GroES
MSKLKAKWDKVLIKPLPESEKIEGAIIIPDMGKETPEFGEIVDVGPGVMNVFGHFIPNTSKIGDIVAIPRIGSFNFSYEGQDYYVTREQEILITIEPDE